MIAPKNFTVYRSSAGSGKTYTLVRDYIQMALSTSSPKGFRNILAITFTNKAAEEMKARVLEQLADLADNPQNQLMPHLTAELKTTAQDIQKRASETLRYMLHNYADLAICTIDKFMHQLVRAFSRDLLLNYDFDVETDHTPLVEESVARLLEQVGRDEFTTEILVDFVASQVENDKSWQIERQLVETSVKTFNPQSEPYLQLLENFPVDQFHQAKKKLAELIQQYELDLTEVGKKGMQLINSHNLTAEAFYQKDRGVYGYFRKLAEGDFMKTPNSYVQKCLESGQFGNQKSDANSLAAVDAITSQLTTLCHEAAQIRTERLSQYLLACELTKNFHQLLLLNELHKSLNQLKDERNLIFVDDFHTLISGVVKNEPAPFIYERTGQRFRHLLIDEFQDTSILQWNNFLPLVTDSLSSGGRVLLVGDGKQAIYRWRGGEVEQFDRLPEIYPATEDPLMLEKEQLLKSQYIPLELEKNYRSLGQVIDFNNNLYDHLRKWIPSSLSAVYDNYFQQTTKAKNAGLVTTHFVEGKLKADVMEQYLQLTADYIAECLKDGYDQRDICIITRNNKSGKAVVNALNGKEIAGQVIEFISDESLLIESHPLVKLALAAFRHLSDQKHVGYQLDFLLRLIHQLEPDETRNHEILQRFTKKGSKEMEEANIRSYLQTHQINWNADHFLQLNLMELTEQFARLFHIEGFNSPYWSFFKQQVFNFSTDQSNDLPAFIEWWEKKCDKFSLSIPEDSNAIRVMTVHKSKGLQFPVVILPFADWDFKHNGSSYWVQTPTELTAAIDVEIPQVMRSGLSSKMEDTPLKTEIEIENARNLLDNLNLLYVATTRAEERLYLLTRNLPATSSVSNVAHWLTEFAASQSWSDNVVRIGHRSPRSEYFTKKNENQQEKSLPLEIAKNSGWKKKIRINLEAGELVEGEITTTHRALGNLVHRILSEIKTPHDLVEQLEWHRARGSLDKAQSMAVETQIRNLFDHPVAGKWFEPHEKILVEQAIVSPGGEVARPDRVMITANKATVVDYKTGSAQEAHEKQIQQYGQLLQQMGYQCELYLYYLENNDVKQVLSVNQTSLF